MRVTTGLAVMVLLADLAGPASAQREPGSTSEPGSIEDVLERRPDAGDLVLANNIWYGFGAGNTIDKIAPQTYVQTHLSANNNRIADPMLVRIDRTTFKNLDPRPAAARSPCAPATPTAPRRPSPERRAPLEPPARQAAAHAVSPDPSPIRATRDGAGCRAAGIAPSSVCTPTICAIP